jgi:hypothetical protein
MVPCMSSSNKEATHKRHHDDMAYTLCCSGLRQKPGGLDIAGPAQVCRMQTVYKIDDKLMIDPIGECSLPLQY